MLPHRQVLARGLPLHRQLPLPRARAVPADVRAGGAARLAGHARPVGQPGELPHAQAAHRQGPQGAAAQCVVAEQVRRRGVLQRGAHEEHEERAAAGGGKTGGAPVPAVLRAGGRARGARGRQGGPREWHGPAGRADGAADRLLRVCAPPVRQEPRRHAQRAAAGAVGQQRAAVGVLCAAADVEAAPGRRAQRRLGPGDLSRPGALSARRPAGRVEHVRGPAAPGGDAGPPAEGAAGAGGRAGAAGGDSGGGGRQLLRAGGQRAGRAGGALHAGRAHGAVPPRHGLQLQGVQLPAAEPAAGGAAAGGRGAPAAAGQRRAQ
mmetsp:Transcript_1385/g.3557  ORF Transcript_1385/g.3557 Transcript_1385/m.3557 type:complete len:320 (+) Transcript_1385:1147-2106(+)